MKAIKRAAWGEFKWAGGKERAAWRKDGSCLRRAAPKLETAHLAFVSVSASHGLLAWAAY